MISFFVYVLKIMKIIYNVHMNNTHIKIKKLLEEKMNYEDISKKLDVSLGTISKVNKMDIKLSEYEINNAIIWVAGWGSRLMPITTNVPKPLVEVNNTTLVESIITSLIRSGINNISLVVGRQKEKFADLVKKYNLNVIENKKWEKHNNISSYYAALEQIKGNTYLIDGDLYIKEDFVFEKYSRDSFAYVGYKEDSNDIILIKRGKYVNSVSMPSDRKGNLSGEQYKGVFYFNKFDAEILNEAINDEYDINNEYEGRYWFTILFNKCLNEIKLDTQLVSYEEIYEVDNITDLIHVDKSYIDWKERKW